MLLPGTRIPGPHWLSAWNGILCLFVLLTACGGDQGAFLFVQVSGVPPASTPDANRTMTVLAMFDQVLASEEIRITLPPKDSVSIGLQLDAPTSKSLIISAGVYDQQGCLIATGEANDQLGLTDNYREIDVVLTTVSPLSQCNGDGPAIVSVSPSSILTTGRVAANIPQPLALQGWGFRDGMQATIGQQLQPAIRVLSATKAIIDKPVVARELGPTDITLNVPNQPPARAPSALTVNLAPINVQLGTPGSPVTSTPLLDLTIGDFDHDGIPDIALLDAQANVWFYGYKAPFGLIPKLGHVALAGLGMQTRGAVLAGDVDGDGIDDLVVVTPGGSAVIHNKPAGTFTPQALDAGIQGVDAGLADMDGDGLPDLVRGQSMVWVHKNLGAGSFASQAALSYPTAVAALATADMNGDQRPDVVVYSSLGRLLVLLNQGNALSSGFDYPVGGGCQGYAPSMVIADFDGNGIPDVSINGLAAIVSAPLTNLQLEYVAGIDACAGGVAVGAIDANDDGVIDLASVDITSTLLIPNAGYGRLDSSVKPPIATPSLGTLQSPLGPRRIPVADFNGDGTLDLVVGHGVLFVLPQ